MGSGTDGVGAKGARGAKGAIVRPKVRGCDGAKWLAPPHRRTAIFRFPVSNTSEVIDGVRRVGPWRGTAGDRGSTNSPWLRERRGAPPARDRREMSWR